MKDTPHILIIGGGAAGFFAAVRCARQASGARVTIVESGRECLRKVRISGAGHCNLTNRCFDPAELVRHYPRGGKALRGAFSRFQPRDTMGWFQAEGVRLMTREDNHVFPASMDSASITDCLMSAARSSGVKIRTAWAVKSIEKERDKFHVSSANDEMIVCDRVLLATGGSTVGHGLAASLGHAIEPPVPSLFTFVIEDEDLRALAGVVAEHCRVALAGVKPKQDQTGPVMLTHWGLSGPAILRLSAWAARVLHDMNYRAELRVNWLADRSEDAVREFFVDSAGKHARRRVSSVTPEGLSSRLWQYLCARAGIRSETRWAELPKKSRNRLVDNIVRCELRVVGKSRFKDEFVTCGGVRLSEIDFRTMESRLCDGFYVAGEALDVDGLTGGYNLQNAWTTGWIAGTTIPE